MYFNKAIALLTCGASFSLLSIGIMAWAPRSAVLVMFGSGVFLLAFGCVITLFMVFRDHGSRSNQPGVFIEAERPNSKPHFSALYHTTYFKLNVL